MWNRGGAAALLAAALLLVLTPRAGFGADDEECYRCHGLNGFFARSGDEVRQVAISPDFFESSTHSLLNCRECHADIAAIPHQDTTGAVSCGQTCHQRDQAGNAYSHESLFWSYTTSVHGETREGKISCVVCHPFSSLAKGGRRNLDNEVAQCASCHTEQEHVRTYFLDVHYLALSQGNRRAPSCPDCHTAHSVLSPENTESSIHPSQLAGTCSSGALPSGKAGRCHDDAGQDVLAGAGMSPLVLPGRSPGAAGWFLSFISWTMLLGLAVRAGIGLARGR
jgi:hypothetical protein